MIDPPAEVVVGGQEFSCKPGFVGNGGSRRTWRLAVFDNLRARRSVHLDCAQKRREGVHFWYHVFGLSRWVPMGTALICLRRFIDRDVPGVPAMFMSRVTGTSTAGWYSIIG